MLLNNGKKRLAIGFEDFKQIIDDGRYYVDKTMLIYDLLKNGGQNNLITRPRRFGKTLNLSMIRYFFDITEDGNAYLFDGMKISEHNEELEPFRNAYPVITLSLKGAKKPSFREALYSLCSEIQGQFGKYYHIADSGRLNEADNKKFKTILSGDTYSEELFAESVRFLSSCLFRYYGKKAVILIDEYDVPLESAYFSGYYNEMVSFIRSLFESALKTNPALEFSVITGCLRISKESIFTGLNNLRINTILDRRYSEFFGFDEAEVKSLLSYYGTESKFETAKRWYDGYLFGNTEVYNPWSIICYVDDLLADPDAAPSANWVNSSSNNIIKTLIGGSDEPTRSAIERLINGGSIDAHLNETVTYDDLADNSDDIWSFLFFTGYLKVTDRFESKDGNGPVYRLKIPNLEIVSCYRNVIMQYFEKYKKEIDKNMLLAALLGRDADGFAEQITRLLRRTVSFYDHTEAFYHGLVSGLLSGLSDYRAVSNRESGMGRSDLILYQQDKFINAVILEFKVCRSDEPADKAAKRALAQINERGYDAEALELGYSNIIKYGVAFKDKLCCAVTE